LAAVLSAHTHISLFALKLSPETTYVLLRALVDSGGDFEKAKAAVEENAQVYAARCGFKVPPALDTVPNCSLCAEPAGYIQWGCQHATCVKCTEFAVDAVGSTTKPAPELGPRVVLPFTRHIPCPKVCEPPCQGVLPTMVRLGYLKYDVQQAMLGALESERLIAVGAAPGPTQRWRACNVCPLFVAVGREQQSAICSCGHTTCLDAGSVHTNCDGVAHDGLSCAAARDVHAIFRALMRPLDNAVARLRGLANGAGRERINELLPYVRDLRIITLHQLEMPTPHHDDWPLPEGDKAILAAAEELVEVASSTRSTRLSRVMQQAPQLLAKVVTAAKDATEANAEIAVVINGAVDAEAVVQATTNAYNALAGIEEALLIARRLLDIIRSGGLVMTGAILAEEARMISVEKSAAELKAAVQRADGTASVAADAMTSAYLLAYTRPCPTPNCGALLEKRHGCNALEPCLKCNRSCCWSCLGPVHHHGQGPCPNSHNRDRVVAAIQASGRSADDAQRQAAAMAAADASPPRQGRQLPAVSNLQSDIASLERDLLPHDNEVTLQPLCAAVRLAKYSADTPEAAADMAVVRAMVQAIYSDCSAGARGAIRPNRGRYHHIHHARRRMAEEEHLARMLLRRERPVIDGQPMAEEDFELMMMDFELERHRERRGQLQVGQRRLSVPLPARFAGNGNADHALERDRSANIYEEALRAVLAQGIPPEAVPATASRFAASFCARRRSEECTRRLASPLLAPGPALTAIQRAQRAGFTALQRAAEAEVMLNLALHPMVQPAVPRAVELLDAAEACGMRADAMFAEFMSRPDGQIDAARLEQAAAQLETMSEELVRSGPNSLLACCGGADAARLRVLVMTEHAGAAEMEQ